MGHGESQIASCSNKAATAVLPEASQPEQIPENVFSPPRRPPRAIPTNDYACAIIDGNDPITDAPMSDLSE
jgi:hypothetical protein